MLPACLSGETRTSCVIAKCRPTRVQIRWQQCFANDLYLWTLCIVKGDFFGGVNKHLTSWFESDKRQPHIFTSRFRSTVMVLKKVTNTKCHTLGSYLSHTYNLNENKSFKTLVGVRNYYSVCKSLNRVVNVQSQAISDFCAMLKYQSFEPLDWSNSITGCNLPQATSRRRGV